MSLMMVNLHVAANDCFPVSDDNIDETYGVNVQFEESEDEVIHL